MQDLSGIIKSTGVALEREAYKVFGAAVENQVNRVLGGIFGNQEQQERSPTDAETVVQNIEPGVWDAARSAAQLTSNRLGGSAIWSPRLKFLFKVTFKFNPEVIDYAQRLGIDANQLQRELTFVIKQIDLPKVDYEYEEVNMYNFRTKVLKSISHKELNFSFYDDMKNNALDFMNLIRMLYIPISRREYDNGTRLEDYGFAFSDNPSVMNTALRANLPGSINSPLIQMIIHQYYVDRSSTNETALVKVNDFVFTNPRITSLDASDQDHENGGTPNMVAGTFDYDALYIEVEQDAKTHKRRTSSMTYDILSDYSEGAAETTRGAEIGPGKTRNPFIDILARQGQRLVQTGVTNVLNRALGGVAGGKLARGLSGAISGVSGALGEAANRTISGVGFGGSTGIAFPSVNLVRDSNAPSSTSSSNASRQEPNDLGDFYG